MDYYCGWWLVLVILYTCNIIRNLSLYRSQFADGQLNLKNYIHCSYGLASMLFNLLCIASIVSGLWYFLRGGGNFDISNQRRRFAKCNLLIECLFEVIRDNITCAIRLVRNACIICKALVIENEIVRMLNLWHSEFTHLEVCTYKVISNFKSTIGTGLLVIWQKVNLLW